MLWKDVFYVIDTFWKDLRKFSFNNKTLFEVLFLFLYFIEQFFLVFLVSRGLATKEIISYFALIVIFTFSLHKVVLESRAKILENIVNELKVEKDQAIDDFNKLVFFIEEKHLNTRKGENKYG